MSSTSTYKWLNHLYSKQYKIKPNAARILSFFTVYISSLPICLVVPELVQNLYLFAYSADQYLLDTQTILNGFTEQISLPPVDLSALIDKVSRYWEYCPELLKKCFLKLLR